MWVPEILNYICSSHSISVGQGWSRAVLPDFTMHPRDPEGLFGQTAELHSPFLTDRFGVHWKTCISNKFPGVAAAVGCSPHLENHSSTVGPDWSSSACPQLGPLLYCFLHSWPPPAQNPFSGSASGKPKHPTSTELFLHNYNFHKCQINSNKWDGKYHCTFYIKQASNKLLIGC